MKVRIEIDENMSEDEIVIRCAQPDERVLKMKRAAESTEGDPEIAFFKDAVQFYPPLDSILFFETGEHNLFFFSCKPLLADRYRFLCKR